MKDQRNEELVAEIIRRANPPTPEPPVVLYGLGRAALAFLAVMLIFAIVVTL